MRIALVLDRFDPRRGGLEQWTFQLASWLLNAAHQCHVVAFEFGIDVARLGIVAHRLEHLPSRLERAASAEQWLRTLDVEVIHDMGTGWYFDVFQPHAGSRIATLRQHLLSLPPVLRIKE